MDEGRRLSIMRKRGYEIRKYFKDHIELEEILSKCNNTGEVFKAIMTSNYFRNLKNDILIADENNGGISNYSREDKAYKLKVNFKIDLGLRESETQNITFKCSHSHNYIEMIYVYDGSYSQEINGEIITLKAGECCILNQNVKHKDKTITMNDTVLFFSFSKKLLNEQLNDYIIENKVLDNFMNGKDKDGELENKYILFMKNKDKNCNEIIESIVNEYFNQDIGSNYILLGYISRVFQRLTNNYNDVVAVKFNRNKEDLLFNQIEKYIEKNINDVSREKLAEELHYNPNYINIIIKKMTNLTYSEYVVNKRLEVTAGLLRSSDFSINRIIKEVGYTNKSYFYKIFTEKFGVKPQEFRKMIANNV